MIETQSDLIQRLLRGDRSGFEDIMAWYADDVLRLCYALLWNEEEAKDVFQEVLLRFTRMVRQNKLRESNGSVKGLLMMIARNICIDKLRKKVDFCSVDQDDSLSHEMMNLRTPDKIADEQRFKKAFQEALSQLSDAQRTILVLHELNDESHSDIAKSLKLTIDCVKMQLYRARKKLRIILEPYFES